MTYTYDITGASDRDKLRLYVGDTGGGTAKFAFHDEELDTVLALNSDLLTAAAAACRILASDSAKRAVMMQMPGVSVTSTEVSRRYMEMADRYEAQATQRTQAQFATLYTETDQLFDSITGRGDIDLDTPIASETSD